MPFSGPVRPLAHPPHERLERIGVAKFIPALQPDEAAAHFRPNVPCDDLSAPRAHQRAPRSRWIRRSRWEQSEFISYGAKQVLRLGLLCRIRPASARSDGVSTPRRSASRPAEISSSAPTTSPTVCLIASILRSSVTTTAQRLAMGLELA